jgi:CubicO group peptidase (beta-lactamase class C family)
MSTGLEFEEAYENPLSDVVRMLYGTGDMFTFAAAKPLEAQPATLFNYSTGTSVILSRIVAGAAE